MLPERESAPLHRLIRSHAPADAKEEADKKTILAFLESGGDPFDRKRYDPGHLTGSAFIVDARRENLLLVHHVKLDRWLQPGGHGEPGETDPFVVALREAEEETGIPDLVPYPNALPFDLDVHEIPARKNEPAHLHLDIRYLLVAPADATPHASSESKGIAWKPLDEILRTSPEGGTKRAVAKILRL